MIRPLRDRHRWLVPLVTLLAALALGLAFAARQPGAPTGRDGPAPGTTADSAGRP